MVDPQRVELWPIGYEPIAITTLAWGPHCFYYSNNYTVKRLLGQVLAVFCGAKTTW